MVGMTTGRVAGLCAVAVMGVASQLLYGCNVGQDGDGRPELMVTEASGGLRYGRAAEAVPDSEVVSSLSFELYNDFPEWNANLSSELHLIIRNTSPSGQAGVQAKARLVLYTGETPIAWSDVDLARAHSTGPETFSVISLPVSASKDIIIPVNGTRWADVSVRRWPDEPIYALVGQGRYRIRFETDLYSARDDSHLGTAVSNFVTVDLR